MRNVKVTLKTVNIADNRREESIFCYRGRHDIKNGAHYLMYSELTEDGKVNTVIKAADDFAVITRNGASGSVLKIEKGKTHRTEYKTPYGIFSLLIDGIEIRNRLEDGELSLEYTLSSLGGQIGRNIIKINIEEV